MAGAVLVLLLVVCCMICLLVRRRRRRKQEKLEKTIEARVSDSADVAFVDGVLHWDDITLEQVIDRGTIGRLFRCTMVDHAEPLVMRRYPVTFVRNCTHDELVTHANRMRELSHPGLLAVLGLATDGHHNYGLVMEYMPRSLAVMLARTESSEKTRAGFVSVWHTIVLDVADAVAHLHSVGEHHYGLHPRNVLFDANLTVKLCDYSRSESMMAAAKQLQIEKVLSDDAEPADPTMEPHQLYMAPELLSKTHGEPTPAADVWSLACLVVRLASLERLYTHKRTSTSEMEILQHISSGQLSPVDQLIAMDSIEVHGHDCSAELTSLVHKSACIDPAARVSAADFVRYFRLATTASPRSSEGEPAPQALSERELSSRDSLPQDSFRINVERSQLRPPARRVVNAGVLPPTALPRPDTHYKESPRSSQPAERHTHPHKPKLLEAEAEEIRVAWQEADKDGDGQLNQHELRDALKELHHFVSEAKAAKLMQRYDKDQTGGLKLSQFTRVAVDLARFKERTTMKREMEASRNTNMAASQMSDPAFQRRRSHLDDLSDTKEDPPAGATPAKPTPLQMFRRASMVARSGRATNRVGVTDAPPTARSGRLQGSHEAPPSARRMNSMGRHGTTESPPRQGSRLSPTLDLESAPAAKAAESVPEEAAPESVPESAPAATAPESAPAAAAPESAPEVAPEGAPEGVPAASMWAALRVKFESGANLGLSHLLPPPPTVDLGLTHSLPPPPRGAYDSDQTTGVEPGSEGHMSPAKEADVASRKSRVCFEEDISDFLTPALVGPVLVPTTLDEDRAFSMLVQEEDDGDEEDVAVATAIASSVVASAAATPAGTATRVASAAGAMKRSSSARKWQMAAHMAIRPSTSGLSVPVAAEQSTTGHKPSVLTTNPPPENGAHRRVHI
jgi:serine/threonine protein kinase